jgi:exodeoxyribonuclease V alpha subunit
MKNGPTATLWDHLEKAALEKGLLDSIDFNLIRTLALRVQANPDLALQVVLACLLWVIRSGGMRIPLAGTALALRLQEFLQNIVPSQPSPLGQPMQPNLDATFPINPISWESPALLGTRLAEDFTSKRLAQTYASILGTAPEFLPLLQSGSGLYFQKYQHAEASVAANIARMVMAPDSILAPDSTRTILTTILDQFPLRVAFSPEAPAMIFDPRQKEALELVLRKRFTVISGGPGTGKTSIAANLLRAWTLVWTTKATTLPRIRLATPTGRAAQRLAESLQKSLESIRYPLSPSSGLTSPESLDHYISQLPCETLHSLLRYNPGTGEYFYQNQRPLPADLVVIDEVSMVDIFVLARLLDALDEKACLVLMGDMDQLPSVDAGSILADLVPKSNSTQHPLKDNIVILSHSHRSEAGILDVTQRINEMDGLGALKHMPIPLSLTEVKTPVSQAHGSLADPWPAQFLVGNGKFTPNGGCRMILPAKGGTEASDYRMGWNTWLESWVRFHYLEHSFNPKNFISQTLATPRTVAYANLVLQLGASRSVEDVEFQAGLSELFDYLDQARILTFTRKGWHGCMNVNRRIRELLIRHWDPGAPLNGTSGFHGSPILILENDYSKSLFNGDVGVMLRIQDRTLGFFRRADTYLSFPAAFLPRHETAFAMTVHKSQGSEYDQVLLVLPEAGNRLLFKETLYTALTRARYFAGIYGPQATFLEAVAKKVVRDSGLAEYLQGLTPT